MSATTTHDYFLNAHNGNVNNENNDNDNAEPEQEIQQHDNSMDDRNDAAAENTIGSGTTEDRSFEENNNNGITVRYSRALDTLDDDDLVVSLDDDMFFVWAVAISGESVLQMLFQVKFLSLFSSPQPARKSSN